MTVCVNKKNNQQQCNCTYAGCPRHGICCECLEYHRNKKQLPACYFTTEQEATWDRSIDNFIKSNG